MKKRRSVKRHKLIWALPFVFVVLGFLAIVAFSFFNNIERGSDVAYTGPMEELRIGNVGEYTILNYIALENGYFREQGIHPIITDYPSGPAGLVDLAAGKQDVQIASEFAGIRAIFAHPELRALAETSRHFVFELVVRTDHGISKPEDLKGKVIGVTKLTASEFFLGRFMVFNQLGLDDVTVIDLPPDELDKRLLEGTVDAAAVFDPHAYTLKKQLGDAGTAWSLQDGQATFGVLWTTDAFATTHSALLERYLHALYLAEQFVQDEPEEAKDIVVRSLQYDRVYVNHMWPQFAFRLALTKELLFTMEEQARWAMNHGLAPAGQLPNYLRFIGFEPLEALLPERVTITHE